MTAEEEERLVQAIMEDSEREYRRQQEEEWQGLQFMLELSASGDVYVPELDVKQEVKEEAMEDVRAEAPREEEPTGWNPALVGQSWTWTETVSCTPDMDADPWSPSPPQSEVVHAPPQAP